MAARNEMESAGYLVAELRFDEREGCFHVHSKELPGFHLCVDRIDSAIEEDVGAALEYYFRHIRGITVKAQKAVSPLQLPPERVRPDKSVERFVFTPEFAFA